jgi:hypothetical protein
MSIQFIFRFAAGGFLVAVFATVGDIFRPKSFAGLFGAAPSVALATLILTILTNGQDYAAIEAKSMIAGAAAFFVYACVVSRILFRYKPPAMAVSSALLALWLSAALGLWAVWLK